MSIYSYILYQRIAEKSSNLDGQKRHLFSAKCLSPEGKGVTDKAIIPRGTKKQRFNASVGINGPNAMRQKIGRPNVD